MYRLWRSIPLIRAERLKKLLDIPASICYKYEGASLAGSHKPNTAVPQEDCVTMVWRHRFHISTNWDFIKAIGIPKIEWFYISFAAKDVENQRCYQWQYVGMVPWLICLSQMTRSPNVQPYTNCNCDGEDKTTKEDREEKRRIWVGVKEG